MNRTNARLVLLTLLGLLLIAPAKAADVDLDSLFPAASSATVRVAQGDDVACTMQYDPVCGCDGITYGNACMARGAGVSSSSPGACDQEPLN